METDIIEKSLKVLQRPICDNCLGRQFGQLGTNLTNDQRGKIIRSSSALAIDVEGSKNEVELSNFVGLEFHNLDIKSLGKLDCVVCNGFFSDLEKWTKLVKKASKNIDFDTFQVGTKLSFDLITNEENLWEVAGIDYVEPIKAEINREVGKLVEKTIGKKFSNKPDVLFLLDLENEKVEVKASPIFIYGEYQKLKRGIPQTKWPSGKYKTSVEEIVAKPFMTATKGKEHKFHGAGREDIDALCFAWRPFVLEILEPKNRKFKLSLSKKIGKNVKVRKMKLSDIQEVRRIKEAKLDKTYRALIKTKNKFDKKDLKKLNGLKQIQQQTPQRVMHRRADRFRNRSVKEVKTKFVNNKTFELVVRGEGGLYIKELISGDDGRTKPNVSQLLENECVCKELDVIKVHLK